MQFLEKENIRLELEMKDVVNELNQQKGLNVSMRDELTGLEMSLKHSKVFSFLEERLIFYALAFLFL